MLTVIVDLMQSYTRSVLILALHLFLLVLYSFTDASSPPIIKVLRFPLLCVSVISYDAPYFSQWNTLHCIWPHHGMLVALFMFIAQISTFTCALPKTHPAFPWFTTSMSPSCRCLFYLLRWSHHIFVRASPYHFCSSCMMQIVMPALLGLTRLRSACSIGIRFVMRDRMLKCKSQSELTYGARPR